VVRHRLGPDWFSGAFEAALSRRLRGLCCGVGLAGLPEPALIVDPCPASLQVPGVPVGRAVRFVPFNGSGVVPDWVERRASGPRVCVSLGTHVLRMNGVPLFRRVVEAVCGLGGVEVVAAVSAGDRVLVGELPAGVRLVESVPLNLFLGGCDVVVHHGGAGTGLTTAAFGLPHLVLPQFADQFTFAERVAAAGVGVQVADVAGQADAAVLQAAVRRLLEESAYRRAAGRLAEQIEQTPSPAELVPTLDQLAATGGGPRSLSCVSC
jgi:glycosyltransferase